MIQGLFPTPLGIYQREVKSTEEEYEFIKNCSYSRNLENFIGEPKDFLENVELKNIKAFLEQSLDSYVKEAYQITTKFKISISWPNLTKPDQSHHIHSHSNSIFSGVYYFEDLTHAPIVFERPGINDKIFDMRNEDGILSYNEFNCETFYASHVKADSCILFPSTLRHRVEKNISGKDRYSIAFNTWFEDNQFIGSVKSANQLFI